MRTVVSRRTGTSTDAPGVSSTLGSHPLLRVDIPIVLAVLQSTYCALEVVPTTLIVKRATNCRGDEGASPPPAHPPIEILYEIVIEAYV